MVRSYSGQIPTTKQVPYLFTAGLILIIIFSFYYLISDVFAISIEDCKKIKEIPQRSKCYMDFVAEISYSNPDIGESICENIFHDVFQYDRYKKCMRIFATSIAPKDPYKAIQICELKMESDSEKDICFKHIAISGSIKNPDISEEICNTKILDNNLRYKCFRELVNKIGYNFTKKAANICIKRMPDRDKRRECYNSLITSISGNDTDKGIRFCKETFSDDNEKMNCIENIVYSIAPKRLTKSVQLCEEIFSEDNEKKSWCFYNIALIVAGINPDISLIICDEIKKFSKDKNIDCKKRIIAQLSLIDPITAIKKCREIEDRKLSRICLYYLISSGSIKEFYYIPVVYISAFFEEITIIFIIVSIFLVCKGSKKCILWLKKP